MIRWSAFQDKTKLVGNVDYEVAKSVLIDALSNEADAALDNHDLTVHEAADDAWGELTNTSLGSPFTYDVAGVRYSLLPNE